jgi:hypothetical protein
MLNVYVTYFVCKVEFHTISINIKRRDSSVCITTGYRLHDQGSGVRFPAGAGNLSLHHRLQTGSGALRTSYPLHTGGLFPGVKRPRREADHSPHPNGEVKNAWRYTSTHNTSSWPDA